MQSRLEHKLEVEGLRTFILNQPGYSGLASLLFKCPIKFENEIDSIAHTDGISISLGKEYWEYAAKSKLYILVHECMHIALQHSIRGKKVRETYKQYHPHVLHQLSNIVMDCIINTSLDQISWMVRPEGGFTYEKLDELVFKQTKEKVKLGKQVWGYEELVHYILSLLEKAADPNADGDGNDEGEGGESKDKGKGTKGHPNQGKSASDLLSDLTGTYVVDVMEPGELGEEHLTEDEKKRLKLDPETAKAWWKEALKQAYGKLPMGALRDLLADFDKHSDINYTQLLRRLVVPNLKNTNKPNYSKPSRRSLAGSTQVYMPGVRKDVSIKKLGVALDTSGSMFGELEKFLGEIEYIKNFTKAEVIIYACDAELQGSYYVPKHKSFKQEYERANIQFKGGGGTAFEPVIEAATKDGVKALLFITDGYGSYGEEPKYPVYWLMTEKYKAPWGHSIQLPQVA